MSVTDRPDHTGTIYISGSVTIPISIESSVVTFNVAITSCTVTLSVNITDSDIMMPVDIQAQYLTLDINIAASAVTLNVNISSSAVTLNVAIQSSAVTLNVAIQSSAVTLNVNISSSSVTLNVTVTNATLNVTGSVTISGTANVTITAQTVGISVQGEWQVEQGNLNVNSAESTPAAGSTSSVSQTVPAGKVLYVYGCSFAVVSHTAGADNPQECYCYAGLGAAGATRVAYAAVNEGTQYASLLFNTPIKVTAGQTFGAYMKNVGSVSTDVGLSFWGYAKSV
jgi:hypothetical protein